MNFSSPLGQSLYPVRPEGLASLAVRESRPPDTPKPRLLDRVREALRTRHYSRRTEQAYVAWIRRFKYAVVQVGLAKRASPHTLRYCFATHLLEDGHDIRTVQELMGNRDVTTTMIYTHVLNRGPVGVRSPADRMFGA